MRVKNIFLSLLGLILLGSCAPTNIAYFQDLDPGVSVTQITNAVDITMSPGDKISIIVNSKDPLLADLFNLPIVSRQIGQKTVLTSYTQGISGYTVDHDGNIEFPVLGSIHIEGMTRKEVEEFIKNELVSNNLIKDPVITVEFMNFTIAVLGEVKNPGRYNIDKDQVTVLDALGLAGDLTIFGKRENIMVLREVDGQQHVYGINLCSAEQVYSSPAFYLQQNDIVYVEPNPRKTRDSTINGNAIFSTSFWISIATLITTIVALFL